MEHDILVKWNKNYELGIKVIDTQHQELVNMMNRLFAECLKSEECANEAFGIVLKEAVEYVKNHFSAEEALFEKTNYPDIAQHKQEHIVFMKRVLEDAQAFDDGKYFVPNNFARFLKDWFLSHIAVSDYAFKDYLLEYLIKNNLQ